MRCPKCHYISFGSVTRCRNCGYEFSLSPEPKPLDLPIQDADAPIGPMNDLQLGDPPPPSLVSAPVDSGAAARHSASPSRLDLPLFSDRGGAADDAPLISAPAVPRQPLSVRRAQPAIPKPRIEKTALVRGLEEEQEEDEVDEPKEAEEELRKLSHSLRAAREVPVRRVRELVVAPAGARLIAGLVDIAILGSIDGAVLYFTLRVLDLGFADVRVLPPIPLAVFLLLLNGGYLTIFTAAGGQTIGKMLAGIKVVAERVDDGPAFDGMGLRVPVGAACLRATAYLVSLLPAGLGFAAILLDREGRALHDRLSDTRVVKA